MKTIKTWKHHGYVMRLIEENDIENYFDGNFNPVSSDIQRFTGSQASFTFDVVSKYVKSNVKDPSRVDFVIVDSRGKIIGETVINMIDEDVKSANFRIGIFKSHLTGQGLGHWMIYNTLEYAFEVLNLNRISLDVFSFNKRALHLYKKMGFTEEGRLREAIKDGDNYADDILMSILQREWGELKNEIRKQSTTYYNQ